MKQKYALAHMKAAEGYASTSSAKRLKVGCLIVKNDTPIAIGINGTYPGLPNECEGEDGLTLPWVRHAEAAALDKLVRSTESSLGSVMFVTHAPCKPCSHRIIDAGIQHVYFRQRYREDEGLRWLLQNGVKVSQVFESWIQDLNVKSK